MTMSPSFWRGAVSILLSIAALLAWSSTNAHAVHEDRPDHPAPQTVDAADAEVRSLIRAFRRTGRDDYLDEAWNSLQPMLAQGTRDVSVLVDAAIVVQARHDFVSALALVDRALAIKPDFDQAWLLRAAILLVRGNAEQAETACSRLRTVPALIAITCRARVGIVRGDAERSLDLLTAVLTRVDRSTADSESLAWTLSVAGDAATSVNPAQAVMYYRESLAIVESTQVRSALVDVLLAMDRVADARDALESGHDALPLAVRRLIVAVRTGDIDRVAEEIARTDHQFRHWIADEDWAHAREMALFYVDVLERPDIARRLARINLGLQREPEDLWLARRVEECSSCVR